MIAGCGRESVFATLQLAEIAARAGYDAIGVRGPIFTSDLSMRTELLTYFRAVADNSPLPVILFSRAERPLATEVVGSLSDHPNIIAAIEDRITADRMARLKEATAGFSREVKVTPVFAAATGRMLRVAEPAAGNFVSADSLLGGVGLAVAPPAPAIKTRTKRVGFQFLAGSAGTMLSAWRAGATGRCTSAGGLCSTGLLRGLASVQGWRFAACGRETDAHHGHRREDRRMVRNRCGQACLRSEWLLRWTSATTVDSYEWRAARGA